MKIVVEGTGIAIEIVPSVELQWIDEHGRHDRVGMVVGDTHECQMTIVERTHRGYETDPSTISALRFAPSGHVLGMIEHLHGCAA
jgi:hypothetical protein